MEGFLWRRLSVRLLPFPRSNFLATDGHGLLRIFQNRVIRQSVKVRVRL